MNKDRKILYRFIALVVFSLLLGGVMGYCSAAFEQDLAGVMTILLDKMVHISPYIMPVIMIPLVMAWNDGVKAKKAVIKAMSADDEALYDSADRLIENGLAKTQYGIMAGFMIFGIMANGFGGLFMFDDFIPAMAALAVFFIGFIAAMYLQNMLVNQTKLLNPEKQGNTLDPKFQQEWFDSCDEAEKAQIGAASYKSYQATSKAIITALVVLIFISFWLPVGPVPVIAVCGIWFVQYYTYIKAVKEMQSKK